MLHAPNLTDTPRAERPFWFRLGRGVLLLVGFWGVVVLFDAGQRFMALEAKGYEDADWTTEFVTSLHLWVYWAVMTPLLLALARRWPLDRVRWKQQVLLHLGIASAVALLHMVYFHLVNKYLGCEELQWLKSLFFVRLHIDIGLYAAIVGGYYALDNYRQFQLREREAAELAVRAQQLEAQLAQAQVQALKMQLHPHFLFNTLNAIAVLVREQQGPDAVRMLTRLSDLLRLTLENGGRQYIPLWQELAWLERYLAIEQVRFGDRLQVSVAVPKALKQALVPALILQPLVENAIRHGIAPTAEAGAITIEATAHDGQLRLTVADDGVGLPATWEDGIGLANTRARLTRSYGSQHAFSVQRRAEGGTRAEISLPLQSDDA